MPRGAKGSWCLLGKGTTVRLEREEKREVDYSYCMLLVKMTNVYLSTFLCVSCLYERECVFLD